jgi:O-antigen/teichoic acid export membrane protein
MGLELFFVGFGQAISILASIFGIRLLTQALNPHQYGELSLALTITMLSQQLFFGPYGGAFARYYASSKEKNELAAFFIAVNRIGYRSGFITLLIGLIVCLAIIVFKLNTYLSLAIFIIIFALISGWNTILDQLQNAARHRVIVAWHQAIGQLLKYLFAFGICTLLISSSSNAMIGYALSASLILLSQSFFYFTKLNRHDENAQKDIGVQQSSKIWSRYFSSYASPFILWGLFTWIQMSSDRWALEFFSSTNDVGFYTVLYQLGYYPITLLTSVVLQFITPILFERIGDGSDINRLNKTQKITRSLTMISLVLTFLISFLLYFTHSPIIKLLSTANYWHISSYLPYMVLSGGLFATGQISALVLLNSQKPHALLMPKIATAMIGTALNFFCAYFAGLKGVVISNIVFSVIYFGWVFVLAENENKMVANNQLLHEVNIP